MFRYFLLLLTLGQPLFVSLKAASETPRFTVIISEVFADFDPVVGLPESPYIELYNRSVHTLNLSGWILEINGRSCVLDSYSLEPDQYLVLVPAAKADLWQHLEDVLALKGFSSLTLSSGTLILRDDGGQVVDALAYERTMGQSGFKRDGGWSLERRDLDHLSHSAFNWAYSAAEKGGTPGSANSIELLVPDEASPRLRSLWWSDSLNLVLQFTKNLRPPAPEAPAYVKVSDHPVVKEQLEAVWQNRLELQWTSPLEPGRSVALNWQEFPVDWAGNRLAESARLELGWPEQAQPGEVVINELLYNPSEGGSDYVELYNRSGRILDLSSLYLSRAGEGDVPEKLYPLSQYRTPFLPGGYVVLCGDYAWLQEQYGVETLLLLAPEEALPNYINEGGSVLLTNLRGEVLDRMDYSNDLHHPFLKETKGVALERLDADASALNSHNWQSAAADVGYGTPGGTNSQSPPPQDSTSGPLRTEPNLFSPNDDGQDDLLYLHYAFAHAGCLCSVEIYNNRGLPVRRLVNNAPAGREGFWVWDGSDDEGRACPPGWYIVRLSWHGSQSSPGNHRCAVALGW